MMLSDGVLHAGMGGIWNFGWGEVQVGRYIKKLASLGYETVDWATDITTQCNLLYGGKPGDDVSIVVVKARKARKLTALIGPRNLKKTPAP
ncbi:MAG: hypothetical protein RQM92_12705 [Candidatus Syntrophopropionicum ammoniitolerans]